MQQTAAFPGSRPSAVRLLGAFVVLSASAAAQSVFWDTNGSTSGSSASTIATGTWDAGSARWNAASDGTGSTAAWQAGDTAVFSAGTNATGAYTVTISGTQTVGGLTFNLGDVTLSGDSLLSDTAPFTITVASGATGTLGTVISGDDGLEKAGDGTLTLGGTNTYSGTTTVNAGTLAITDVGNLGTGNVNITNGSLTVASDFSDSLSRTITIDGAGSSLIGEGYLWFNRASATTTTIDVTDGGTLSAATSISLADSSSSTHTLNVTGTDSSATAGTVLYVGYLGDATVNLGSGGTVSTHTLDLASQFGGSAEINLNPGGTLAVSGGTNAIFTGSGTTAFNLAGGTLQVAGSDLTTSVPMTLVTATDSTVDTNGFNATLSGVLSGDGALTKAGAGTLTLAATNIHAGGTSIDGGTLLVADAAPLGSGDITVNAGGTLNATGDLEFNTDRTVTVTGTGAVLDGDTHVWFGTASGADTLTSIGAGATLRTGTTFSLADVAGSSSTLTVSGIDALLEAIGNLYVGYAGDATATVSNGGTIKTDAIFSIATTGGTSTFNLNDGGTLQVGGTGGIAIGTGSGTFNLGGGTIQVIGSDLTSSAPFTLTADTTSTVDTNSFNATLNGTLSGSGGLAKSGAGTLTLTGANSFTGDTTVDGGTLTIDGSGALDGTGNLHIGVSGDGSVAITDGGQVGTGASGYVILSYNSGRTGSLTVTGTGSHLTSANNLIVGLLGTGSVTIGSGGTVTVDNDGILWLPYDEGASGTLNLNAGGTLEIGAGGIRNSNNGTAQLNLAGGTLRVTGDGFHTSVPAELTGTSTVDTNGFTGTLAGALSGAGSLTKTGAGSLALSGANDYSGGTIVSAGTLTGDASSLQGDITNHATVVFDQSGDGTYAGAIDGTGTLIKQGTGNLTLDGTTSHSGGTTVSAGTLTGSTSSLQGDITNDAALVFDQSSSGTYSGSLSGNGSLTKTGTGSLTLSGTNSYAGDTTIAAGTLQLGAADALSTTNAITVNASGTLALTTADTAVGSITGSGQINLGSHTLTIGGANTSTTFSGAIDGSGALNKTGSGTLTLTGTNTYSGGTTISAGTLTGDSTSLQGDITNHAALVFNQSSSGTYAGALDGTGTLTKTGSGTLTLSGANSYSGGTTVSAGLVSFSALGNFGTGNVTLNGGGLIWADGTTADVSARLNALGASGATFDTNGNDVSFESLLTGSGSFTKQGTGTLVLSGTNTSPGAIITIDAGTLRLATDNAFASATSVVVNSGAGFDLADHTGTVSSLNGAGAVTLGAGTLTVGDSLATSTFSGVISGSGALVVAGNSSTLALTGNNTFEGGTTVTAGTLEFNSLASLGTGNLTVNGGTLSWATGSSTDISTRLNALGAAGATFNTNGNDVALSADLSTAGTLAKVGSGTLTLGDSTSTLGSAVADGGTFALADGADVTVTGTLAVGYNDTGVQTIGSGSTLSVGQLSLGPLAQGTGTLNLETGGTLQVGGANGIAAGSGTAALNLSGGTLRLNAADFTSFVPATLTGTTTIDTNGHNGGIYGPLTGSGGFTKTGSGVLTVTNANSYAGGTTVNAGTLIVNTASDLGNGIVTVNTGAALAAATHLEFHTDVTADGADAVITSPNHFEVGSAGDGSLTLANGALVGSGTTTTLAYYGTDTGTVSITGTGSTLYAQSSLRVGYGGAGTLTVGSGGTANADHLVLGSQSGSSGTINLNTGGTLIVGGAGGISVGDGSGTFNLAGGTLKVGGDDRVASAPASNAIDVTALPDVFATVIAANTPQAGDTGLTTSVAMNLSNASTIDTNGSAATLAGVLAGTGSLTKTGAGTLTLTGANTYSGGTTIGAGTVIIGNSSGSAFGTGDVTVSSGATLAGTGAFTGSLTIASGGTLAPGNSPGLLSLDGDLTLLGILEMELGGSASRGTDYDALDVGGELTLGGTLQISFYGDYLPGSATSWDLFDATSLSSTFAAYSLPTVSGYTWDTSALGTTGVLSLTASAVPEPSTYAFITGGSFLLLAAFRRRLVRRSCQA